MPTVLRKAGFNVLIRTNDHQPPHVHVIKGEGHIVIYLNGEEGKEPGELWVRESHSLSRREQRQALEIVEENYELLIQEWERIHGTK